MQLGTWAQGPLRIQVPPFQGWGANGQCLLRLSDARGAHPSSRCGTPRQLMSLPVGRTAPTAFQQKPGCPSNAGV